MSAISQEQPLRERAAASARRVAALLGEPELGDAEPQQLIERLNARLAKLGAGAHGATGGATDGAVGGATGGATDGAAGAGADGAAGAGADGAAGSGADGAAGSDAGADRAAYGHRGPDATGTEGVREQLAARDRLDARYAHRFEALEAARGAVDQLRELTAPRAIVDQAPTALCRASGFRRALLSVVGEGRMQAQAVHFEDDPAGAAAALGRLRERPIALEHPLIEAELLRRRRATIVAAGVVHRRVDPMLREVMAWRSYAAAPLISGAALIGVIHADRGPGTDLDVLDRDVLWVFTSALGQAYESAVLRRQLRQEREQLRGFLDWLGARSGELADAPVRLSTFSRAPRRPLPALDAAPLAGRRDDRAVFDGLLTRRELEVLRLLAEGRSNRAIAEELVIAPGTVKFHVNRILRKLRVSNRSQAVARYLQLLGVTGPERTASARPRT